jgi:hypothetical protein
LVLTPAQAAGLLNVRPATLKSWRAKGIGPTFVKRGARLIGYLPDDERCDRRSLIVADFQNGRWMVDIGMREPATMPPDGVQRHLDDGYRARKGEVISGWMTRKQSKASEARDFHACLRKPARVWRSRDR